MLHNQDPRGFDMLQTVQKVFCKAPTTAPNDQFNLGSVATLQG